MENASKALIIAGAILLAIVIISLGLIVVNNVRDTVDNTNLSGQEIQSFNAKFTAYEGSNISGSRVNSLIQQVIATNQASYNQGYTSMEKTILIKYKSVGLSNYAVLGIDTSGNIKIVESGDSEPIPSGDSNTIGWALSKNSENYPASVETGSNYTVSIQYYKGLVRTILVK